jgi:hypothetical protein
LAPANPLYLSKRFFDPFLTFKTICLCTLGGFDAGFAGVNQTKLTIQGEKSD